MPVSVGVDSLDNLRTSIYKMRRGLDSELDPQQFFTNEKQQGRFFDPLNVPIYETITSFYVSYVLPSQSCTG